MRSSLLGIAFAVSCAASPPPQSANDGEVLYRKMEAALAAAKNLVVGFTSSTDGTTIKGTFRLSEGKKLEMDVSGDVGVKKYTLNLKSDGEKMNLSRTETPPPPVPLPPLPEFPAPKSLAANVAAALARGGAWLAQEYADGEYRAAAHAHFTAMERQKPPQPVPAADVATWHKLEGFRLGKTEAGSTAVTYDLVRTNAQQVLVTTVTVWIDAKGHLPTKREGAIFTVTSDGKKSAAPLSKWSETYTAKSE